MKNIMMVGVVLATVAFNGCDKDLPTPEKMTAVSTLVGKTAGYACELSKAKAEVKEVIADVIDIVSKVVPIEDQTFVDAWTPLANIEIQKLVDAKKLDEAGAQAAKAAISIACEGIDYVFVKYPKAKDVKDLVSAAKVGFVNGYKSVVKTSLASGEKPEIDKDAYAYLKARIK